MTQKEKLIELLCNTPPIPVAEGMLYDYKLYTATHIADHLLENGVIVLPCEVEKIEECFFDSIKDKIYTVGDELKRINDDFTGGSKVWLDTDFFKEVYTVVCVAANFADYAEMFVEKEAEEALAERMKNDG